MIRKEWIHEKLLFAVRGKSIVCRGMEKNSMRIDSIRHYKFTNREKQCELHYKPEEKIMLSESPFYL